MNLTHKKGGELPGFDQKLLMQHRNHARRGNQTRRYLVVINHEEQYAVWPANLALPVGWTATDQQGTWHECMALLQLMGADAPSLHMRRSQAHQPLTN